ncbi:MAG: cupin domain-containing protein [Acidobacteria bacterium]|nr:cupin domain-containing protein [Acidobacteriota bacterium]
MDKKNVQVAGRFSSKKMQKINLFESRRMFCDLYCMEPGQSQAIHSHEGSDKIYFVLEGEGKFSVAGEDAVLGVGDLICAFSGQPHGVENLSQGRLVCLVFMAPHPKPDQFPA